MCMSSAGVLDVCYSGVRIAIIMAKKKKISNSKKNEASSVSVRTVSQISVTVRTEQQVSSPISVDGPLDEAVGNEETKVDIPFKNKSYEAKKSNKRKIWKGLKQLITQERSQEWVTEAVFYSSIDAPPSFKPAKKYSDLSGLLGSYTDPHTHLRFAQADEYRTIQTLPSDIVSGYLALRKASNPVG